jgi:hypothetical protein
MARTRTLRVPLRVVFYKEDGDWIAHCLEFDLLGDGPTKNDALEGLARAITIQASESLESQNFANLFSPADGEYFRRYFRGRNTAKGLLKVTVERLRSSAPTMIERVDAREYDENESQLVCV